ncbi:MAG: signal recognition particle-docking protein FtsY [Desulfosarcinaceae bacterium]|nr:signal recognition particle-docking protein FtsY [Desulfosarcinaceae bacterium]
MALKWFQRKRKDPGPGEEADRNEGAAEGADLPQPAADDPPSDPGGDALARPSATASVAAPDADTLEQVPRDTAADLPAPASGGFFNRLKRGLAKTREILTTDIEDLFQSGEGVTDEMLEELEELLITADLGVQTSLDLVASITKRAHKIDGPRALKETIRDELVALLAQAPEAPTDTTAVAAPRVVMVVGVNGVGKTTTIGKIAAKATRKGERVIIAAADTFRAAAAEQLNIWSERAGAQIVRHKDNADPAAVAFDAVEAAIARKADLLLIDTAGRLHTKVNLMEELKKIHRTVAKRMPGAPHEVLLILDATTGQNALSQAKLFNEAMGVTGLALTKLDGTAKGGIVVSICGELQLPLKYIGVGEGIDDLQTFDPQAFVKALF